MPLALDFPAVYAPITNQNLIRYDSHSLLLFPYDPHESGHHKGLGRFLYTGYRRLGQLFVEQCRQDESAANTGDKNQQQKTNKWNQTKQ